MGEDGGEERGYINDDREATIVRAYIRKHRKMDWEMNREEKDGEDWGDEGDKNRRGVFLTRDRLGYRRSGDVWLYLLGFGLVCTQRLLWRFLGYHSLPIDVLTCSDRRGVFGNGALVRSISVCRIRRCIFPI